MHVWEDMPQGVTPKGVVLACHDVGQHGGRFAPLAERFNMGGYVVIAHDQRTFGTTAPRPELLGAADQNTFAYSVQDIIYLFRYYSREYRLPLYLLGQGYGAYLVMAALQLDIIHPDGVMLLSMAKLSTVSLRAALSVAKALPQKERATGVQLPFMPLPAKDVTDPLMAVVPNAHFYIALLTGLLTLCHKDNVAKWPLDIPYLLAAGMADTAMGKEGADAVAQLLYMRGLGVEPRFFGYEDVAHDMLTHALSPRIFGHLLSFLHDCEQ